MGVLGGGDASVLFPLPLSFLSSRDAGGLVWVVPGDLYRSERSSFVLQESACAHKPELANGAAVRGGGPLQRWSEQCLKEQNLPLAPWERGRRLVGCGDILTNPLFLQDARLGRWQQVRGLWEDRVPRGGGAV